MTIDCPRPSALPALAAGSDCPVNFDQFVRILLQLKQSAYADVDTATELFTASVWTPKFASATATKVIATPLFAGMTLPKSEARFVGSDDNNSIGGVASYAGEKPVTIGGNFYGLDPAVAESLRAYSQFSLPEVAAGAVLTAYFVNRSGAILCQTNGGGIVIQNWRVGSVGSEGYNARNETPFGLTLLEGWDSNIQFVKPPVSATFNPLGAL